MTLLLLNLLQGQPRISLVVIIGAALAFIAGVSLLVYFYRRYKRIEKEPEEDWDSARRSLFLNAPLKAPKIEETSSAPAVEAETAIAEEAPVPQGATRVFSSNVDLEAFAPAASAEPAPQVEAAAEETTHPEVGPPSEPRETEIPASPEPVHEIAEAEVKSEAAPFEEDVWAGLEIAEKPPFAAEPETAGPSTPEPLNVARVEQSRRREPFEPPRIQRISHREPYEPPSIEPLTPREAAATRELRSGHAPEIKPDYSLTEERRPRGTERFGSASGGIRRPITPSRPERETREFAGDLVAGAPAMIPEASIPASAVARVQRAGSVLGLPAEPSHQPLVFGERGQSGEEVGIGALTNYGKDIGPRGGRGGTIALLIVVVLLGGAVGLYFFVPSVHSRVGAFVSHLRGTDVLAAREAAMKVKAQVIPSTRPEVNKNLVTARGAVDNISDEPLENLTVEVSLQRGGDAPPELRTVPVTPNPLPPRERGTFEFEYDGKRDTGFAGYTITRLFSNGTEVRFRAPGQK